MGRGDPGLPGRAVANETLPPIKRSVYWKKGRYMYDEFSGAVAVLNAATGKAFQTAAQGQTDFFHTPQNGHYVEMFQTTAQTLGPVAHATKGLEIALDQVDNESVEYVPGGNRSTSPLAFVLGTDPSFFIEAKLEVTQAAAIDQMLVGFRKQEAFAVPTSFLTTGDGVYTDFCGIGFCAATADPNPVGVASDLNGSGSTTVSAVSFTWADTLVHRLRMEVINRKPRFFINGIELGGSVAVDGDGTAITAQATKKPHAYTFDTADTVVPFIFVRQDALVSPVYISRLEVGHLDSVQADPNNRGG